MSRACHKKKNSFELKTRTPALDHFRLERNSIQSVKDVLFEITRYILIIKRVLEYLDTLTDMTPV